MFFIYSYKWISGFLWKISIIILFYLTGKDGKKHYYLSEDMDHDDTIKLFWWLKILTYLFQHLSVFLWCPFYFQLQKGKKDYLLFAYDFVHLYVSACFQRNERRLKKLAPCLSVLPSIHPILAASTFQDPIHILPHNMAIFLQNIHKRYSIACLRVWYGMCFVSS